MPTEGLEPQAERPIAQENREIAEGATVGSSGCVGANPAESGQRSNEANASIEIAPVEAALADALRLASQAGQWGTVEVLSRELAARRLARTAPEVPSIEAERAKRGSKA